MGTKTRAELVQTVLENLGILDAGQTIEAEDSDLITMRLGPKIEELNARDIAYVPDDDAIDDAIFLALADIMAFACATAFGVSPGKRAELMALAKEGEQALRDFVRLRRTRKPLSVYFPGGYGMRRAGWR